MIEVYIRDRDVRYVRGDYIFCEGDVRGSCGIRHRNVMQALICLAYDRGWADARGNKSDRYAHLYDAAGTVVAYGHEDGEFYCRP